ncbi:heterodisulfide reductase, partial [Candidatus Bathyarchaeota archaeon]
MPGQKVGAVLVVGGGIAGIQASLDLAEMGFKVYLLDRAPAIGGVMSQLDKTFPTNDCATCILAPKLVEAGRHPNITLITNAEVIGLEGEPGNFTVKVRVRPRYIDPEKCTGCGLCAEKCPVEAIDEFNQGLSPRPAIFIRYPQAVPRVFMIDREKCIGCGTCSEVCRAGAVRYDDQERIVELKVGAVILAPGFQPLKPKALTEFGYGRYPNVVTSIEFERILSASGPFGGLLVRPSDGEIPRRIAFIQCVGSRDERTGVPYCSSVCCMYSIKQAVIAREHAPIDVECTIFYMDMRTYGKGFEAYRNRAEEEYGVRFVRCRVPRIYEDPRTHNLIIRYLDLDTGTIKEEEFDLVVLAVGFRPPEGFEELARALGIELNEFGFCKTSEFGPLETSRPGIFVCGAFSGPKDIPDSVAEASGAAAKAASIIASERGKLVARKEYPPEIEVRPDEEPRIGVFICHCGVNIGGIINVKEVVEYAKTLPGVVYAEDNLYTCSQDTQERIKKIIREYRLNRVVVASCTPRTHEPLFRETLREAGLNPYLFEMANIRDQCSWVHMHEPEKATEKAKDLVRSA